MDSDNCELACRLVSSSYISQGAQALSARRNAIKALLSNRRLPQRGWDEATIEMLLQDAALMDSNNFPSNVGVGEREARVACPLIARRHYRLAHGVGRSGDITAEQPKAAGSSLLAKLGAALAGDAIRLAGLMDLAPPVVLPLATGMAMTMTLLAVTGNRGPEARHVVWSRIDQKTCLKAITAANLVPEVIELRSEGDQLVTDLEGIEAAVNRLGADKVAAIVTTTSCFAPRACDDVVGVAKLCARLDIPHVINNAYGVQSQTICARITAAARRGRIDAIIQSTDKNFMVPVGGSLVVSPVTNPKAAGDVARAYPGRASSAPLVDLLVTLLHWGAEGWGRVLEEREALYGYLLEKLTGVGESIGERVLETPDNPISIALTVDGLLAAGGAGVGPAAAGEPPGVSAVPAASSAAAAVASAASVAPRGALGPPVPQAAAGAKAERASAGAVAASSSSTGGPSGAAGGAAAPPAVAAAATGAGVAGKGSKGSSKLDVTYFGSMLFSRGISGTRVVAPGKVQDFGGMLRFDDYGSHCAGGYPHAYLTAAAAVGTSRGEVDEFCVRLVKAYWEFRKKTAQLAGSG